MAHELLAYTVYGLTDSGEVVRQEGRNVWCGHRHKTLEMAGECLTKMETERPGCCDAYRTLEFVRFGDGWKRK